MVERRIGDKVIRLVRGDITDLDVEAFAFDITSDCQLGSGYGGAIAQRGGKVVQEELSAIGTLPAGEAVVTTAGQMKAQYIIHTNGPKFLEPDTEEKLRKATKSVSSYGTTASGYARTRSPTSSTISTARTRERVSTGCRPAWGWLLSRRSPAAWVFASR